MPESDDSVREMEIEVIETDKGEIPTFKGLKDALEQVYKDFEIMVKPLDNIAFELAGIKKKQEQIEKTLESLAKKLEARSPTEHIASRIQQDVSRELDDLKRELRQKHDEQDAVIGQLLPLVKKMSGALVEYYQDLEALKKKHEQDLVEARLLLAESIALLERTVNELRSNVLELMKMFMEESKEKSLAHDQENEKSRETSDREETGDA